HAAALIDQAGEVMVSISDPWDRELLAAAGLLGDIDSAIAHANQGKLAIAGMGLMPTGMVEPHLPRAVDATAEIEELRRVKTLEEIELLRRAAELADRGYQRFVETVAPGVREFELVAEVEAFL